MMKPTRSTAGNEGHNLENLKLPVRPPERNFISFQYDETDQILKAGGSTRWKIDLRRRNQGIWRVRFGKISETSGGPEVPPSWAVAETIEEPEDLTGSGSPGPSGNIDSSSRARLEGDVIRVAGCSIGSWGFHSEALRFSMVSPSKKLKIYGLGEKSGLLERSGRVWEMWNTDEPIQTPSKDPLYVSIPFCLLKNGTTWFGLFVDNPARQYWDSRMTGRGRLSIEVEDDYLDFYILTGSEPSEISRLYVELTGQPPMPPLWALGFHQSRYSYMSQQRVLELASKFRANDLPGDVIHLDIDYMRGYRVFTWDPDRFPDPGEMCRQLHTLGFRIVTILDPGVKCDPEYRVYREGTQKDVFCRMPDGEVYRGAVWPGTAVFPDFSRSDVREWWARQHSVLFEAGVAGVWNDMNEPADFTGDPIFRPDFTVPEELEGGEKEWKGSFKRLHNIYGSCMNAAAREAFTMFCPDRRGFVISRAGYAGVQRHAGIWTGDNMSWWEHLSGAVPMLLNLSISGVALVGTDVGGFQEDASAQLYARWFAFGVFTPYFRNHTEKGTSDHEPWSFGSQTLSIARHYLKLRYELLPYLYTAFYRASFRGEPIMKPLFFEWPGDVRLEHLDDQYLYGEAFMLAPVVQPNKIYRDVYLPEGRWYDFWDDSMWEGPVDLMVPAPVTRIPLFVRGGSIVCHEEPRMHTEEERGNVLLLDIYPDESGVARGELYVDAEEGHEYSKGVFSLFSFSYELDMLHVKCTMEAYPPPWTELSVRVHQGRRTEYRRIPRAAADPLALDPSSLELPKPFANGSRGSAGRIISLKVGTYRLDA